MGFRGLGFRGLGSRGLVFRGLGFMQGFRSLGSRFSHTLDTCLMGLRV